MNTRERFLAIMNFEPFDRLPIIEWAPWWGETLDRWYGEGLPPDVVDRYAICEYFGMDVYKQDWFPIRGPDTPQPTRHGAGVIESEADYEQMRPHLYPARPVDSARWEEWADEQARGDVALWFTVDGFFWFARGLLGIEEHFYAFHDQPELIHRINSDLADWILVVIEQVCSICTPDFMTVAEDMSYNHGAMLSKDMYDEFMHPYYARIVPELRKRGVIPLIDSDGDISVPAHWFEESGLEGILPLERQAGVDIESLRRDHPRMKFVGHFDKMTMPRGEDSMRAEFERLLPTAARGGFLPGCDHQTPPGVSYEQFQIYLRLFGEYAERAGRMSRDVQEA